MRWSSSSGKTSFAFTFYKVNLNEVFPEQDNASCYTMGKAVGEGNNLTQESSSCPKLNHSCPYDIYSVRLNNNEFEPPQGQVVINGVSLGRVQDWYARKIGYVLQLAIPYYEELTVRQNLFFAAHMRLPKKMSFRRKFERVEQILAEVCQSVRRLYNSLKPLFKLHLFSRSTKLWELLCL